MADGSSREGRGRVVWGTVLLRLGLGGFFDGIVLHQVLQWHHMLTNVEPATTVARLELNTVADGFFHLATYVATGLGLGLLWSGMRLSSVGWSTKLLVGGLLVGCGTFNVVEGVVDHHLLKVHHVMSGGPTLGWDLAFLAWGTAMLLRGLLLMRAGDRDSTAASARSGYGRGPRGAGAERAR